MMDENQKNGIGQKWYPAHILHVWALVYVFRQVFWQQRMQDIGAQVSNEQRGAGVHPWRIHKCIYL